MRVAASPMIAYQPNDRSARLVERRSEPYVVHEQRHSVP
jgi:hypothetical protein